MIFAILCEHDALQLAHFEIVIALARQNALTDEEKAACDVVEDFVVNQLGEE